ncbi:hypothetical protein [Roseateles oligotrophus]|uniref:Uncharacterized protein n=1 Tax=Roseateles oligotrophus TaxID=1769250 RepID=A0ABT2YCK1_9BURK|nr:hypothetical protein [Roseateles oligotrophus]MCV2367778.1 hypothetical protein [Roseateles oligotrophus]
MNALLLKWLTAGIIGLVVCSAIWLAGSLKMNPAGVPYRLAAAAGSTQNFRSVERTPRPAEYAASAATRRVVELR